MLILLIDYLQQFHSKQKQEIFAQNKKMLESEKQSFEKLPENIRKLVPQPVFDNNISFNTLNSETAQKVSRRVKTKTLLELSKPVDIPEPQPVITTKPIILVFCQPSEQIVIERDKIFPYAPVSYASWLQGAGARCVPLPYNINEGSMQFLLQRSHGLLIPGGGANLYRNWDKKQGQGPVMIGFLKIWRFIQKMWTKGIYYPVWGTCLGFQIMLMALTNDVKVLSSLNSRGHQLQIYSDYQYSTICKKMPVSLKIKVQNFKLINFQHSFGISLKKFLNYPKLMQKLAITQISKDKDGRWFCSGLEGRHNPIFITQYHPQKQAYQWTRTGDNLHNKDSIQISQFLAASFVSQCRKCRASKQFGSPTQEMFYMIQQYKQIHTPQKMYKVYAIDFKFRQYDKNARKQIKNKRSSSVATKMVKQPFV